MVCDATGARVKAFKNRKVRPFRSQQGGTTFVSKHSPKANEAKQGRLQGKDYHRRHKHGSWKFRSQRSGFYSLVADTAVAFLLHDATAFIGPGQTLGLIPVVFLRDPLVNATSEFNISTDGRAVGQLSPNPVEGSIKK